MWGLLDPRHTVPRPAVMDLRLSQSAVGTITQTPTDATKRSTRRVVPVPNMCVKKKTHTLDKPRGLGHAVGSAIQTVSRARERFSRPIFSLSWREGTSARERLVTHAAAPQRARANARSIVRRVAIRARARITSRRRDKTQKGSASFRTTRRGDRRKISRSFANVQLSLVRRNRSLSLNLIECARASRENGAAVAASWSVQTAALGR